MNSHCKNSDKKTAVQIFIKDLFYKYCDKNYDFLDIINNIEIIEYKEQLLYDKYISHMQYIVQIKICGIEIVIDKIYNIDINIFDKIYENVLISAILSINDKNYNFDNNELQTYIMNNCDVKDKNKIIVQHIYNLISLFANINYATIFTEIVE